MTRRRARAMNEWSFSSAMPATARARRPPPRPSAAPPRAATSATASWPPRRGCLRGMASSAHRSPTSRGRPASPPARSTSTSAARTTCSSRSSRRPWPRRLPKDARRWPPSTDPEARLRRIARLHLARLGADRDLAVVFQVELRQTTKFMTRFSATGLRDYLGIIRDVVTDGQAQGRFRRAAQPDAGRQDALRRARRDGDQLGALRAQVRPGVGRRRRHRHLRDGLGAPAAPRKTRRTSLP